MYNILYVLWIITTILVNMSKKNWVIASGTIFRIENANVFEDCTKRYVGAYIKSHVKKLFNHFIVLSQCDNSGDKIYEFIKKYTKINKYDLSDLSNEEFIKVIKDITRELKKYNDEELVDIFQAYSEESDGYFVNISELVK